MRASDAQAEMDQQPFYTYVNDRGRTVYVSHAALIPPQYRQQAEAVDLAGVSLNHTIGNALDAATEREHKALVASTLCEETRTEAAAGPIWHVVAQYPHWLGIGAAVLLLLVTAPMIARRVGAAPWIRVLAVGIPLLLFLGVVTQTMREASATMRELHATSSLCAEDRWREETTTGGRLSVVQSLREKLLRIHREREAEIEKIFAMPGR